MSQYFYEADKLEFQYHTLNTLREVRYRLHELTTSSRRSIEAFQNAVRAKADIMSIDFATPVMYGFSAALAPLQTFKDLLPLVIPGFNFATFLGGISDGEMFLQLRHAIVHDGQQTLALSADGRFYVAVNIRRTGQRKTVEILAPAEDIETITLRFYEQFGRNLADALAAMDDTDKLRGPAYSTEWFQEAAKHPSLKRFDIPMMASDSLAATQMPYSPLDMAHTVTLEIAQSCRLRLEELANIPLVPFP
ncbi:hypothetical protein WT09_05725 [Burkholderia stagnalis]|uniref:hypothetical protein n=1 Tax=Burkholderia stagnalis TaxID=1503054 RepID=UPI00075C25AB|nr:hypothetical protein [Burkholderia stagnalis]KVN23039.1 hypothetical protein WT09_05725 [Burkholderia stagnalis]